MILVLGATGFVGRALVPALLAEGEHVRAASRHPPSRPVADTRLEWVSCDVTRPRTLATALEGVDCVYYLVHSMGSAGERDYRSAERAAAREVALAAAKSQVRRIVYLGGVEPQGKRSEHLASRLEVGEILRSGRVPTIELRASMIIGAGSASFQIVRDLALRLPFMLLPRWLSSRSRPIALADVVQALLDARRLPIEGSASFDIPGPEMLSGRDLLMRVAALDNRWIPSVNVPVLTPRLSAMWLALVTSADYRLARELVLGLTSDLLPRDERFWSLTGHTTLRSFDDAAREALHPDAGKRGLRGRLAMREEEAVRRLSPRRVPGA
jgi:uncharacterized protein YbjT (DUF2867 family)